LGFHAKPIGLLNVDGYFDPLLEMVDHAVAEGFVAADHARLLYVDEDPGGLLARLRAHTPSPRRRKWRDRDET
jgi:predicted Rossmann-fold nucleotide-binding protein